MQISGLSGSVFDAIQHTWPGNNSHQQRQRILGAMLKRGSVTTMDAVRFLEIVDPRPRISELRAAGWKIVRSWATQESETGGLHRVGKYQLEGRENGGALSRCGGVSLYQASLFDA
ncbi:helix-turn-helix domain-containing protein [Herbaspirillum sp. C7C2]|nr:helix-turn-helix domain-containing protein [Herbaspirillum sp. C7C2]MCI1016253.1 helix-turn-helix domain-containing protein [Herbaspirillum sp. C7C2]